MSYSEQITEKIIRPLRDQYRISKLGPKTFIINSRITGLPIHIDRNDFIINNKRGQKLHVSHFAIRRTSSAPLPCVIFLHSNNGSRIEGLNYVEPCLEQELELVLFDCSGSGLSEGDYVTLGVREAEDLEVVLNHLYTTKGIWEFALWGRSMGAVTALIYTGKNLMSIRACIYDSPFSSLSKLIKELAKQKTGLPQFFFSLFLSGVEDNLKEKCGIQFDDFKLEHTATKVSTPAIFITSKNDQMIKDHHSINLYEKYRAEKHFIYIDLEHHQPRQSDLLTRCATFIRSKTTFGKQGLNNQKEKKMNGIRVIQSSQGSSNYENIKKDLRTEYGVNEFFREKSLKPFSSRRTETQADTEADEPQPSRKSSQIVRQSPLPRFIQPTKQVIVTNAFCMPVSYLYTG